MNNILKGKDHDTIKRDIDSSLYNIDFELYQRTVVSNRFEYAEAIYDKIKVSDASMNNYISDLIWMGEGVEQELDGLDTDANIYSRLLDNWDDVVIAKQCELYKETYDKKQMEDLFMLDFIGTRYNPCPCRYELFLNDESLQTLDSKVGLSRKELKKHITMNKKACDQEMMAYELSQKKINKAVDYMVKRFNYQV